MGRNMFWMFWICLTVFSAACSSNEQTRAMLNDGNAGTGGSLGGSGGVAGSSTAPANCNPDYSCPPNPNSFMDVCDPATLTCINGCDGTSCNLGSDCHGGRCFKVCSMDQPADCPDGFQCDPRPYPYDGICRRVGDLEKGESCIPADKQDYPVSTGCKAGLVCASMKSADYRCLALCGKLANGAPCQSTDEACAYGLCIPKANVDSAMPGSACSDGYAYCSINADSIEGICSMDTPSICRKICSEGKDCAARECCGTTLDFLGACIAAGCSYPSVTEQCIPGLLGCNPFTNEGCGSDEICSFAVGINGPNSSCSFERCNHLEASTNCTKLLEHTVVVGEGAPCKGYDEACDLGLVCRASNNDPENPTCRRICCKQEDCVNGGTCDTPADGHWTICL